MSRDEAPEGHLSFDQVLERGLGDLTLVFEEGPGQRKLRAFRSMLWLASPVLRNMIEGGLGGGGRKRHRGAEAEQQQDGDDAGLALKVDDDVEAWIEVLRVLYNNALGPADDGDGAGSGSGPLTASSAFKILPIAHKYDMRRVMALAMDACTCSMQSVNAATSCVRAAHTPAEQPRLLDWLVLGSRLHHAPLVKACVVHLRESGVWGTALRAALCSPEWRPALQALSPDTLMELLDMTTRLSPRLPGSNAPDLSLSPRAHEYLPYYENAGIVKQGADVGPAFEDEVAACCLQGSLLVYASTEGSIHAYDLERLEHKGCIDAAGTRTVHVLACCPDGETVISGESQGVISVCNVRDMSRDALVPYPGQAHKIRSIAQFSANKVLAGCNNTLSLFDVEAQKRLSELHGDYLTGYGAGCLSVCDSGNLALSCSGPAVHLWDLRTSSQVRAMEGHTDRAKAVAITGCGSAAASSTALGELKTWDLGSGGPTQSLSVVEQVDIDAVGLSFAMDRAGKAALSLHWGPDMDDRLCCFTWDLARGTSQSSRQVFIDGGVYSLGRLVADRDLSTVVVTCRVEDEVEEQDVYPFKACGRSLATDRSGQAAVSLHTEFGLDNCLSAAWDLARGTNRSYDKEVTGEENAWSLVQLVSDPDLSTVAVLLQTDEGEVEDETIQSVRGHGLNGDASGWNSELDSK